jgi:ATP-binding protein involved in chromosome partitioning
MVSGGTLGAVIVSTPQDVALIDARKGVNMFRKIHIPVSTITAPLVPHRCQLLPSSITQIFGSILNQSHFTCSCCSTRHQLFGSPDAFKSVADDLSLDVLGEIPVVPVISSGGDSGVPVMVQDSKEGEETRQAMRGVARAVWKNLGRSV